MIRLANLNDLDRIDEIYSQIHTEIEEGRAVIGWIRNIYPERKLAETSIRLREMYVLEEDGVILACGRINRFQGPEYDNAVWSFDADPDSVLVLHTLVVAPEHAGRGIATRFVAYYEDMARRMHCSALRIDTNALNLPARSLYKKLGYTEACIIPTSFNGIDNVMLVCLDKPVPAMGVSEIARRMTAFSEGNLHDINHFMKVYGWAKVIGEGEGLDARTQEILEIAALMHDIACPLCREKYGGADPKHQEEEGGPMAREFLQDTGLDPSIIERIAFLVAHHHTISAVNGMDWQILLEADYIVNADEGSCTPEIMRMFTEKVFKTETGRAIMREIYGV